jgi:hypothetical protein
MISGASRRRTPPAASADPTVAAVASGVTLSSDFSGACVHVLAGGRDAARRAAGVFGVDNCSERAGESGSFASFLVGSPIFASLLVLLKRFKRLEKGQN